MVDGAGDRQTGWPGDRVPQAAIAIIDSMVSVIRTSSIRRLKPITHRLVSATVITPTALEADGLDTALMVMGPEKAMAFAKATTSGCIW